MNKKLNIIYRINTDLGNKTNLPSAATGTYGSYRNVVAGFQKQGNIFNIFFKGQVTGTIDIPYTEFGIDSKYKLPESTLAGCQVAKVYGGNGGMLTVKAYVTGLQLTSNYQDDNFYFNATIPLE